jgi:Domain of unknown function (DUF4145)
MSSPADHLPAGRTFICPQCSRPAIAAVCGQAVWDGCDDEGDRVNEPHEWLLLQCSECRWPSLQSRQDYGDGFGKDEPLIVYPSAPRLSLEVPAPLRREFDEAQSCFSAKAYGATVVMVRRLLEGTCQENNVNVRQLRLDGALRKLREEGLIDDTLAEWANALRVLGNEGAHYTGKEVPRDDAEDALAFAEALLENIYILRKRFLVFAERRGKRRAVTSKSDHPS